MAVRKSPIRPLEAWQDPKATPYITLDNIAKNFGSVKAVDYVSLTIFKEEFFSILGSSGCGKTTLLRLLAGFEQPTSGHIYIDGVDVTHLPPYARPVNMMFQSYALFPHMTVAQNVSFGLQQENLTRRQIQDRVLEGLRLVQMETYKDRKPHQLSGGQRQRVALARSLVKRPKLLLLDEPLAALDKQLREQTQFELVNIQEKVGVTVIMVTHDQEEAMTMSSRIAVMDQGRVRQTGTPYEIYEYPNSRLVANFVGSMNVFEGIVTEEDAEHIRVRCPEIETQIYVSHAASAHIGSEVSVAVRPEKILITKRKPDQTDNWAQGTVEDIAYLGDLSIYYVTLSSGLKVECSMPNLYRLKERNITWEDQVYLYWQPENGIVLTS